MRGRRIAIVDPACEVGNPKHRSRNGPHRATLESDDSGRCRRPHADSPGGPFGSLLVEIAVRSAALCSRRTLLCSDAGRGRIRIVEPAGAAAGQGGPRPTVRRPPGQAGPGSDRGVRRPAFAARSSRPSSVTLLSSLRRRSSMNPRRRPRFHPDRAPGGHRDHRRPDRPAVARRAGGPRGGPPRPVHQQSQADRARPAQLPHVDGQVPDGRLEEPAFSAGDTDRQWGYGRWTGWSARALLLGYLDQTPMYNAANFALGPGTGGGMIGSLPNSTVYNAVISLLSLPLRSQRGIRPQQQLPREHRLDHLREPHHHAGDVRGLDLLRHPRLHGRHLQHHRLRRGADRVG